MQPDLKTYSTPTTPRAPPARADGRPGRPPLAAPLRRGRVLALVRWQEGVGEAEKRRGGGRCVVAGVHVFTGFVGSCRQGDFFPLLPSFGAAARSYYKKLVFLKLNSYSGLSLRSIFS